MLEGDPHPSTILGFRVTRDLERAVTRLRSGRKKKRVEFEDVQQTQSIPNPAQENFPQRCITQLADDVNHIYYTRKELTNRDSMRVHDTFTTVIKVWKEIPTIPLVRDVMYWFYEYCGVGHPIVKEYVKFTAYPHLRAWKRGNRKKTNNHIDHCTIETIT
ncbi:hypothetical protein GIB67_018659 [Kingdonia uniflora]|uniref:Uncharacterized protein n=1 Tax=Kingdonia uniflora TaxID=39325 RepID=A0A7J7M2I8_9MAGN|nr:hypothetical protein GIB67_018659 [Kingdonia uniflora]